MGRVLIETAQAFGRPVREVLGDPYALTLWSWGGVQAIGRERRVVRMGERTDLAGLVAVAFHEPAKLSSAENRYLKAAGLLKPMQEAQRQKLTGLLERYEAAVAKQRAEQGEA